MPIDLHNLVSDGAEVGLSFLYPEVCQFCHEQPATPAEGYVCSKCSRHLRFILPPLCERCGLPFQGEITDTFRCSNCHDVELHFSRARSVVAAQGMVLEIVHRWKYQRELWFEPFLAGLLIQEAASTLGAEGWDFLVPVPLHPLKEREREFNQSLHLARRLSVATGLPVRDDAVRRIAPTRVQASLSREERRANVRKAFTGSGGGGIKGKRAVLVDDVLTTGATTSACARALREAGATDVCVWTVARGLLH